MKWTESELVTPISFGIIEHEKSYWANHFYSVIQCMNSQKNLQYSPMKLESFPLWSLNDMRGFLPLNFFEVIQQFIKNFGFQYFLVSLLNQKSSLGVVEELLKRLSLLYGVNFPARFDEYSFHISGWDSSLSKSLSNEFTEVFPPVLNEVEADRKNIISGSDLCLLINNPLTQEKVGIFGEVEGVHGNKLRNKSYWNGKSDFCVFSFGVVKGNNKGCYAENINVDGIDRVCIYFEENHFVVKDFHMTLEYVKHLFLSGPSFKLRRGDDEFDYFLDLLKSNWSNPVGDLLYEISRFIDGEDLIGSVPKTISIITDIRA